MAERDPDGPQRQSDESGADAPTGTPSDEPETLRAAVEAKYDFDDFGPADMAEMTLEEWEAAFDPDTWITGPELIDRVEAELRARVAAGELFAVVERHAVDGEPRLLAYTDASYAVVAPDGTVDGDGAVRREVEPLVALCSMASYEVAEPPDEAGLPDPSSVEPGSGDLGHRLLLAVAGVLGVAGLVLVASPLVVRPGPGSAGLAVAVGLGFLVVGLLVGMLVANARLSDRFRAAEYRDRLEAAGVGTDDRPSFLPAMGDEGDAADADERAP